MRKGGEPVQALPPFSAVCRPAGSPRHEKSFENLSAGGAAGCGDSSKLDCDYYPEKSGMQAHLSGNSTLRLHERENDHVADARLVRQQHDYPVDAEPQAARRRHAVFECRQEILVQLVGFFVAGFPQAQLLLETPALVFGIVQFTE